MGFNYLFTVTRQTPLHYSQMNKVDQKKKQINTTFRFNKRERYMDTSKCFDWSISTNRKTDKQSRHLKIAVMKSE